MSGGRRTQTFTLNNNDKRRAANSYPALGGAGNFRGLKKSDLAGAIFGCTHQTFKECVTQFIFGLPAPHFAYVQNISPGLPLCLFNYSNRKMHGVFEAASYGQMNINPYAWTAFGSEKTQFPAQMQQEITELRCCVEKTRNEFQNSFEIQELLKKNTLMEQKQRFALAGAVLGGALYALGGFDGKQYLKSVERFDPREGPWVQLEEMSSKRGSLSTAVLNEKIYAIGGFDGSNFLSSVEVFDPRAGSWLMVDSTVSPRAYGAAAVIGDSIYIIGGFGEKDFVDSVESYQDGVGWQVSSQSMCKRSFLTAVVL